MKEQSILKKIFIKIKKYILIIFLIIGNFIRSLFGSSKKTTTHEMNNNIPKKEEQKESKKETPTSNTATGLPDEDNIKANPHNNSTDSEDTDSSSNVILEIPKQKLYKVYTKDNELKYLPLDALLDLIIKEELERIYKVENFKLKSATTREIIKVEQIKERILPEIIIRVENETLRNAEVIREEVVIKLEEDLIKNPLFPPRPQPVNKENKNEVKEETKKEDKKEIYSLAFPKKKEIKIKTSTTPKVKKENKPTITNEQKNKIDVKLDTTNVVMVQNVEEIPEPTLADNIKEAALIGALSVAAITNELLEEEQKNEVPEEKEIKEITQEKQEEKSKEEKQEELEKIKEEVKKENKELEPLVKEEIIEELKKIEEKNKEELEELKKQIEEKIEKIQKEEETIQKQEEKEQKIEEEKEKIKEKEIIAVTDVSEEIIEESKTEINKNDFFEKDYERIERQIDKMLDDLTNTYLKYDGKLSEKQKKKLKAEEQRLRDTKERIKTQKHYDIQTEQKQLDETIKESELSGLEFELEQIHKENQQEVSNDLLGKMSRFEGMTAEQVANVDKRVMLKRFNKANILLEMTSLLALPFVRNKYFFYFTVGLVIDNHFNFVNAFFNRKYNRYEPMDLSQIKQGQDALNGALDITYKNLVELEYLEQRALGRYPELSRDPRFISQVTRLRTNLNKKYNNLMKKNKTLEKYRMKTKKQLKQLKLDKKKNANEN